MIDPISSSNMPRPKYEVRKEKYTSTDFQMPGVRTSDMMPSAPLVQKYTDMSP